MLVVWQLDNWALILECRKLLTPTAYNPLVLAGQRLVNFIQSSCINFRIRSEVELYSVRCLYDENCLSCDTLFTVHMVGTVYRVILCLLFIW